jgi:predicted metal-dependent phosphoesterase TrpH
MTLNSSVPTSPSVDARRVDMHVHTNESDGVLSPSEVIDAARQVGLSALSITDHDAVTGVPEDAAVDGEPGFEVLSGIEFTAERGRCELHILGYGIDPDHDGLRAMAERLEQSRFERARLMVKRLRGLGVDIEFDAVLDQAGPGNIGRPHVARALMDAGHISTMQEAFDRYIGLEGPAYAARWRVEPGKAIELVHEAGGLAFLAHPKLRCASEHIRELVGKGLDGIEVYHSRHSDVDVAGFSALADKLGILKSGGSDCHGPSHDWPALIGTQPVPYEYFEQIKNALANR